jgi:hypothetical protein
MTPEAAQAIENSVTAICCTAIAYLWTSTKS